MGTRKTGCTMKYIIAILFIVLCFSCKTPKPQKQVPIVTIERIQERLVPYALPGDSSSIKALFECDSLNRVQLKELSDLKASSWQGDFSFNEGVFNYNLKRPPDTVYLPVKDTHIEREKPVEVPIEVYINRLTNFQKICFWAGIVFMGLLGISTLCGVYRLYKFIVGWKRKLLP
jgi:hypothetical protein